MKSEVREQILLVLLRCIYADQRVSSAEKTFIQRIFPEYEIPREQFLRLQKEARRRPLNLQYEDFGQAVCFALREQVLHTLDSKEAREIENQVLQAWKSFEPTHVQQMDPECRDLLYEISMKDWQQELEDFRRHYVQSLVEEELSAELNKRQAEGVKPGVLAGAGLGLLVALLMGPAAAMVWPVLMVFALCGFMILSFGPVGIAGSVSALLLIPLSFSMVEALQASSMGFLVWAGCAFGGALNGAGIGAGLGMRYKRMQLSDADSPLREEIASQFHSFVLQPRDLLRFWELRLETFLKQRQNRVSARIEETTQQIAEIRQLIEDIHEVGTIEDQQRIQELEKKSERLKRLIGDAESVGHVLQKLENRFSLKIGELRQLIESQNESERRWEKRRALGSRMAKALEKADETELKWRTERNQIQEQISGMVESFQSQLVHTKDFVQAEIELLETH